MKILVLSTDYPPTRGGIARLTFETTRQLAELGNEIVVIATLERGMRADLDVEQRFQTIRIPATFGLREFRQWRELVQQVRSFRPDVIWSAAWYPGGVLASFIPQVPFVFSTYGSEIFPNFNGIVQIIKALLPFRRLVFGRAAAITALSKFTRDYIVRLGAPPGKIELIGGGVGQEWFEIENRPVSPPVILTVGRLDWHKGHEVVVRALPEVLRHCPEALYHIVGPDPGNWPRIRSLAEALGVDSRVRYLGAVSEAELRTQYAQASVFAMLSRELPGRPDLLEGFGLTFLEANAVGLPVVAGNSGGVSDAVDHEQTGYLVAPESVEDVAQALSRLLTDRALARRLGEQGRHRALKDFTWQVQAKRLHELLERAAQRHLGG
ncbi:MAG: glycosyl transferase family 1 [Candidatus Xenobia bacterium]|jgi:phosphatidylinositol alpha-1,6-mannosyltransferase